ncbi:Regulator of G-protein signaling 20 [Eumeta japonica]|uniref:Regulator of G-protein signaling 20 n=1 Tax=Eumeta variegata TaxID=151549 RepID=A0A4C1TBL1_EUMVA|nr:Regulator of G-protein signaling 20 [Eumeta japonica]
MLVQIRQRYLYDLVTYNKVQNKVCRVGYFAKNRGEDDKEKERQEKGGHTERERESVVTRVQKKRFSVQVSLDSRVREIVNRNMVEPTPHTFDEAQLQIYTLMHRDSYPR